MKNFESGSIVRLFSDALLVWLVILIGTLAAPGMLIAEVGVGIALWLQRRFWGLAAFALAWLLLLVAHPITVAPPFGQSIGVMASVLIAALLLPFPERARKLDPASAARVLIVAAIATLVGPLLATTVASSPDPLAAARHWLAPAVGAWLPLWAGTWLSLPVAFWLLSDGRAKVHQLYGLLIVTGVFVLVLALHQNLLPPVTPAPALALLTAGVLMLIAFALTTFPGTRQLTGLALPPLALPPALAAIPAGVLAPAPVLAIGAGSAALGWIVAVFSAHRARQVTDISDEKQLSDARKRSEAQARAVLDNAVDAIVTITPEGRILTFNHAAQHMFQYSADEIIGRNVSELMPEPYRSEHDGYLAHHQRTGEKRIIGIGRELVAQRKDGSILPIYLAVSRTEIDGEVTFLGVLRDIRREKAAQEEIRRRNEQLSVTLDNAPLGMVTFRFDEPFSTANRAFAEMVDYSQDRLAGMLFEQLLHADDVPELKTLLTDMRENRIHQLTHQMRLLGSDDRVVPVICHASTTHDQYGRPDMVIAQIEDMSAEFQAQEAAREQQEKLTHVARLSTLGEMTAGIAHEINQPLTAIAMYAQSCVRMLDAGVPKPERLRDALAKLNGQSLRAGEVIDRVQKLVSHRAHDRESVDLNTLVKEILRLAESDARVNDIQIVAELEPDLPPVIADPVQLQQVLLNLIRNGIDSMTEDGCAHGSIVRIQTSLAADNHVEARVADTGSGVPYDVSGQLFTPFTTTKANGMGMGLSICKSIINDHGGLLAFSNNNAGPGATFYFRLPINTDELNPDQEQEQ